MRVNTSLIQLELANCLEQVINLEDWLNDQPIASKAGVQKLDVIKRQLSRINTMLLTEYDSSM